MREEALVMEYISSSNTCSVFSNISLQNCISLLMFRQIKNSWLESHIIIQLFMLNANMYGTTGCCETCTPVSYGN